MLLQVGDRRRAARAAVLLLAFVQCSFAAVSKDQIIVGLRRSIPGDVIERIVRREGIAFTMDDQIASELRSKGAQQSLIQTLFEISSNPTPAITPSHGATSETGEGENVSPRPSGSDTLNKPGGSDEKNASTKVPATSAAPRPPIEYIDWWSQLKPHIGWTPLKQNTPATYEYGSVTLFAAKFWLSGPKDVLSKIGRVDYYFDHPSYHPPHKIGKNASDGFTISYKAWGCIENVRITIVPRDSNFRARDSYSTDFPFCEELFSLRN